MDRKRNLKMFLRAYRPKLYVFFYNEIEITLCILVTCERYLITVKSQFKDFLLSKILSVCTKCPKWLKKSTLPIKIGG